MNKKIFKKAFCLFLCAVLVLTLSSSAFAALKFNGKKEIKAVAHRGYSAQAPENTLAAFRLAGEKGYYGCEFDIHPTKDKVWVVNHNDTVDKMTNGSGKITDMTFEEISKLKIDAGNNLKTYPNEKIPTFEETLDTCEKYSLHPVIEVKGGQPEDMESIAEILKARTFSNGYTIISFTWELLAPLRKLLPEAEIWMLANEVMPSHIKFCKEHKIDGISFNYMTNPSLSIAFFRLTGLKLIAWTVDDVTSARKLAALGVGAITTNKLLPEDLDMSDLSVDEVLKDMVNDLTNAVKDLLKMAKDYIAGLVGKC